MKIWDWSKLVPEFEYYDLVLANWPGWDKPNGKEPAYMCLEHIKGNGKQSRDIAIDFDDISEGRFYYRDFTNDSMPFVNDGESYQSMFVFQYVSDLDKFKQFLTTDATPTHPAA